MSYFTRFLGVIALLALTSARPASAQCPSPNQCVLPPGGCVYVGPNTVFYPGGSSHAGLLFEGATTCDPFPGTGNTIDSFFDRFVELELDTGSGFVPHQGPAPIGVRLTGTGQSGNQQFIETEILSLELTGGTLPPLVRLRESPTLASRGQIISTDLGGGQYQIDSFFDVFTELSLDGGATWMPGSPASRSHLVPNHPTPVRPASWGALKVIYR